jgi:hypothetical protein
MGFNNENSIGNVFALDLETGARKGLEQLLGPVSAPKNYKDAEKIAAAKAEKLKSLVESAALNINLNWICGFGIWTPEGAQVLIAKNLEEERKHLAALGYYIANAGHQRRIISFNGLSFDLLTLVQRARIHRLSFPALNITPSWRSPHTDLMEVLTFGGKVSRQTLDFYCRIFDIDTPEPDDVKQVSGADIGRLIDEERWDLIEGHCRYDVTRTGLLAQALPGVW